MCGIAGITSETERDMGEPLQRMLQAMRHRGPDGAGIYVDGQADRQPRLQDVRFNGRSGRVALGHVRLAITGGVDDLQPFLSRGRKLAVMHNGEIYNHEALRSELTGRYRCRTRSDSEVILRLLEKHLEGQRLEAAVRAVLPRLDGVYALAVTDNQEAVLVRDRVGVRQLYYCHDGDGIAFASEKKALRAAWGRSVTIRRLLPGCMAVIRGAGMRQTTFWHSEGSRPRRRIQTREEGLAAYGRALEEAVRKRVARRKRVGVIFSGGIDSLLIARLVQRLGVPMTCYVAGRRGAADIEWAQRLARRFGFPVRIKQLDLEEIERILPRLIQAVEDHSLNQIEVALPIYAAMQMAAKDKQRVILTGQGADELFGGYPWYGAIVDREGYASFEHRSWEDTFLLYKECLEREDKISMAHSLELRVPYLDPQVIEVAFQIVPELKIRRGGDTQMKRIHREYALSLGIPRSVAYRRKEAAQHGANVHSVFDELAARRGPTESELERAGYDPEAALEEKLGSSSRYGFRYGDRHLWKPRRRVQFYLDTLAAGQRLLPGVSQRQWRVVSSRVKGESSDGERQR